MSVLRWSGQIANSSEYNGGGPTVNGRLYCSVSRTNNTITVTGIKVGHSLSGGYDDWEWQTDAYAKGSRRLYNKQTKGRTGTTQIGGNWYYGGNGSHSFGVGTGSGSFTLSGNWKSNHYGDLSAQQGVGVSYPAAGSPSGTTGAPQNITRTSIKIRNNVTSWGAYCTAGSVRSYRATNSSFSGQVYISTTDNALVTHSGLTPNRKYWFRGWQSNGAGLTSYQSSTRTAVTLPNAPALGTPAPLATTCTIPTTIDVGGGEYAITKKYRIRVAAGAWGAWTNYTGNDIEASGLLPNTEYEIQTQSVTTAGTTDGGTTTFTTLPAGKLIYSDGSVVNAIPRVVKDGEPTAMVNVNIVEPS